jgi:hypothetical protein
MPYHRPDSSTDSPNGVSSCRRDPVTTAPAMTATVTALTKPADPRGSRRHGPARAAAAITAAQARASPYRTSAGCGWTGHGARPARIVPAGTAAPLTMAVR